MLQQDYTSSSSLIGEMQSNKTNKDDKLKTSIKKKKIERKKTNYVSIQVDKKEPKRISNQREYLVRA